MHKLRTHHKHPDGRLFAWMALIMGFGLGLILPIFPNFVKSIVGTESTVSIFFAIMALLMLTAAVLSTVIFEKVQKTTIVKLAFFSLGSVFFLLIFVTRLFELAILDAVRAWFEMFLLIALALFVRDFAKKLGREEGRYYKFQNIGFLTGPLIGGFLATKFDYEFVFILAACVIFLGLAHFYHKHIIQNHSAIINDKKATTQKLLHNFKDFFSNSPRRKDYLITLAFMSWISFKRLYIPLYVVLAGYLESMSGMILALALLPSILLEVKVGEYGEKHNVRKPLMLGFFILGLCLTLIFISPYPLLNFFILILASIGAAFIEPLQEDLLFRHLPKEREDELYGIYMTSDPLAFFITPAIGALILFLLPFKFVFLIFGILLLFMSLFSSIALKHL